jgi:hypothetical protein
MLAQPRKSTKHQPASQTHSDQKRCRSMGDGLDKATDMLSEEVGGGTEPWIGKGLAFGGGIGWQWPGEPEVILIQGDESTSESVSSPRAHSREYFESLNSLPVAGLFHTQITAHALIWKQRADTSEI